MMFEGGNYSWGDDDSRWCYLVGRSYVCVRISIMVLLGIVTGAFCLARVIQYHCYKAKNYHQYIVYYTAILLCLISVIHWIYVVSAVLDLLITYLILVQILVISWFFYSWAFRILQQEKLFTYLILPVLCVVLLYYTAALIWAATTLSDVKSECAKPQWLLFTGSQVVHVQLFLLSVIYITKKLNDIRTMRINRFSQKAQLWGLAVMYELVSLAVFAYDIYFLVTKSVDHQCGTNFRSHPVGMTIMFVVHKIVKYFVPQWTICVVFAPLKPHLPSVQEFEETDTLSWANRPNYKSTFYEGSSKEEQEPDTKIPLPVNSLSHNANPILPRTPSNSSSCNSPWVVPSRSWANSNTASKTTSPPLPPKNGLS